MRARNEPTRRQQPVWRNGRGRTVGERGSERLFRRAVSISIVIGITVQTAYYSVPYALRSFPAKCIAKLRQRIRTVASDTRCIRPFENSKQSKISIVRQCLLLVRQLPTHVTVVTLCFLFVGHMKPFQRPRLSNKFPSTSLRWRWTARSGQIAVIS